MYVLGLHDADEPSVGEEDDLETIDNVACVLDLLLYGLFFKMLCQFGKNVQMFEVDAVGFEFYFIHLLVGDDEDRITKLGVYHFQDLLARFQGDMLTHCLWLRVYELS